MNNSGYFSGTRTKLYKKEYKQKLGVQWPLLTFEDNKKIMYVFTYVSVGDVTCLTLYVNCLEVFFYVIKWGLLVRGRHFFLAKILI